MISGLKPAPSPVFWFKWGISHRESWFGCRSLRIPGWRAPKWWGPLKSYVFEGENDWKWSSYWIACVPKDLEMVCLRGTHGIPNKPPDDNLQSGLKRSFWNFLLQSESHEAFPLSLQSTHGKVSTPSLRWRAYGIGIVVTFHRCHWPEPSVSNISQIRSMWCDFDMLRSWYHIKSLMEAIIFTHIPW